MFPIRFVTALSFATAASAQLYPGQSNLNHTCVLEPKVLSCPEPSPQQYDSCCAETYGGLVLQTQFWQTWTGLESKGQKIPPNTWTLHGLWPDFCNGSYTQYCDLTRQYDPFPSPNTTNGLKNGTVVPPWKGENITLMISKFGRFDLLAWMNHYWVNQGQSNDIFWAHEFSKHATCFSTFNVPCYGPQYVQHQEVIEFFETTIKYYERYPTYKWLARGGIKPSNTTRASLSAVQGILTQASKAKPYIGCSGPRYNETDAGKGSKDNGRTVLSEVWYYNHVKGRPQEGRKVPVDATGSGTNCASTDNSIWYYVPTPSSLFQNPPKYGGYDYDESDDDNDDDY